MHPFRPFIQYYYGHVVKTYIHHELEQRFAELKEARVSSEAAQPTKRGKSAIALALESFLEENKDKNILEMTKLDDTFAEMVTHQIRLFLFAGNDTPS